MFRDVETTNPQRLTLTLDEQTAAGRIGRELLDVRSALAEAVDGGAEHDIERLRERERSLTVMLLQEVTVSRWTFGVFGVGQKAGQVKSNTHGGLQCH